MQLLDSNWNPYSIYVKRWDSDFPEKNISGTLHLFKILSLKLLSSYIYKLKLPVYQLSYWFTYTVYTNTQVKDVNVTLKIMYTNTNGLVVNRELEFKDQARENKPDIVRIVKKKTKNIRSELICPKG